MPTYRRTGFARRTSLRTGVVAIVLAAFAPLFASPLPSYADRSPAALPEDCMPLSEVKAGMRGVAYSVIKGFELSEYSVEILGVEKGGLPGTSMIMALVEGPGIEQHGIVAGMSGSPVYIDGKVIGAIAYGYSFAYKPIAGITPIEAMLPLFRELDELQAQELAAASGPPAVSPGGSSARAASASGGGRVWNWRRDLASYLGGSAAEPEPATVTVRPRSPMLVRRVDSPEMRMIPLTTPLYATGISSGTEDDLRAWLAHRGIRLQAGGSSAGSNEAPSTPSPPLVGGSSLSMPLMTGDVTISGVGTVTYRRGDQILAFGHPAFQRGTTKIPMGQAFLLGYMESYQFSFKMAETREVIGAIRKDGRFGIGGIVGDEPERVPMTVHVGGSGSLFEKTYKFSLWEDAEYLPLLAGMIALPESISASSGPSAELTAVCEYEIEFGDGRILKKSLAASSRRGVTRAFMFDLITDLFLAEQNPYKRTDVKAIRVNVELTEGFKTDRLERLSIRYDRVRPGEALELTLNWEPYRGDSYTTQLEVPIAPGTKPGLYVLHVGDSAMARRIDEQHDPGLFIPFDHASTLDVLDRLDYPQNVLSTYLFAPTVEVSLRDESWEGVPSSIAGVVASTAPADILSPKIGTKILEVRETYPNPIEAGATLVIEVTNYIPE